MKNIPLFSTESGVASLVLEEIPYKHKAYVKLQSTQTPEQLLRECVDFCKAVGADTVLATGHVCLNQYPIHSELVQMRCKRANIPPSDLSLKSVEDNTLQLWCDLYNTKMHKVSNASTMTVQKLKKLTTEKSCYFVCDDQETVGIGMITSGSVEAIASLVPGMGTDIMGALCGRLEDEYVTVEVARSNVPAVKLYEKLGFIETEIISTWYSVYNI